MSSRIVVHSDPLELLRAIEKVPDADGVRTNHAVGFVVQAWTQGPATPPTDKAKRKPDDEAQVLVTVWQGENLRLIFTKLDWSQCKIVSPMSPTQLAADALPFIDPLANYLLTLAPFSANPSLLRSICGPQVLVDAFLRHWPHARKPEASMHIVPASISVAPPFAPLPAGHSFERIREVDHLPQNDLDTIADLQRDFFGNHETSPKLSRDDAIAYLREAVPRSGMWIYRSPPSPSSTPVPVGFVTTGRPTLRTCAIRMVYVAPSQRGKGLAKRMVSAVVRAHLIDAPRVPLDLASGRPPSAAEACEDQTRWGGKDEVCLFVEPDNPAARRAYASVGFIETEAVWCDADVEGIEPGHW
ncbi:GNAT family N-acetyltransferase [Rhodotorula paludigena]|uniref:GNAT family N-acetyltransferase n=1 Tax=Rhodotorula paludigena TaxID=86838 RepID=UPI00317BA3C9